MIKVLERNRESLLGTVFIIMVVLIIAASLMYQIEFTAQPEVFSSIPEAMWWGGIVTIATIGYGDMVPITPPMGKALGFVISLVASACLPSRRVSLHPDSPRSSRRKKRKKRKKIQNNITIQQMNMISVLTADGKFVRKTDKNNIWKFSILFFLRSPQTR